jgi:hypothetical protein
VGRRHAAAAPRRRPGAVRAARASGANAARLLALAGLVVGVALALLVAYAAVAVRWADAGSVLNLPAPALFFIGRLRENVLIGALLVAGQVALRHRRRCGRANSKPRASRRSSARRGSRR